MNEATRPPGGRTNASAPARSPLCVLIGAACCTKSGGWVCNPTFNDYSLVMAVTRGGVTRAQRYTRLRESTSSRTARELGDFVFAMARKRTASAPHQ